MAKLLIIPIIAAVVLTAGECKPTGVIADAKSRAELTFNGLFNYYWKQDTQHKNIKFLFVCGQLGFVGTSDAGHCSCSTPSACVNCYRWFTGVLVESVATYGIYMNTTNHSDVPDTVYNHSPYNSKWDATSLCTYIDDFLWYGIAYSRVYDWLKDEKWLNRSIDIYEWAWKNGWDEPCGGFWWSNCPNLKVKFNIELVEAMHLAAKLAYTLPNETRFLNDAERLWNWFFSYDNGYGLMTDKFLVSTAAIPITCCNATSNHNQCINSRSEGTSYNQGLLLSAAAYLYLSTGNDTYLNVGIRAFDAVVANYTSKEGVLIDEPRGFPSFTSGCSSYSDPGGDWYSFNGIFMLHLGYFTELLVNNGSMPSDVLKKINDFVEKTSDSAWSKSAVWPPFNKTNVCEPGSSPINKNVSYPKFHWWWGENVERDPITPADPGYYFHKSQLRCATMNGNDTQIWEGQVKSEDKCRDKCDNNVNCSKYLWQLYESEVPNYNCWIWSYNRTNHICNISDYEWNVGIKRPKGNATCAAKCGTLEPQKLDHGVCYCDSNCSKHLDCCSDYADHCLSLESISCKGQCDSAYPRPLLGGGYCWCSAGCNIGFTGGNCCSDYPKECENTGTHICLDGRSQGSALNLFLSHTIVSKVTKN